MVSLLFQQNDAGNIPQTPHPDHLLFLRRFIKYHPEHKQNVCFLEGGVVPPVDDQHVRYIHTRSGCAQETILEHFDADGRLFALVGAAHTNVWLPHADYVYITHVHDEDPEAVPLASPMPQQFVKIGTWPWGRSSTRSVWFRIAHPPPPRTTDP